MKKIDSFKHFNKEYSVKEYSEMYKKLKLDITIVNLKKEGALQLYLVLKK